MNKSSTNNNNGSELGGISTYQAGILQATVHRRLRKFSDNVLAPYDITKMQWQIVGTVADHRATGVRITDLARLLGTNLPYMTNTVNLLESKKILARLENSVDSRSRLITLRPSFAANVKKIETSLREALRQLIFDKVDPTEFKVYMKVLTELSLLDIDD